MANDEIWKHNGELVENTEAHTVEYLIRDRKPNGIIVAHRNDSGYDHISTFFKVEYGRKDLAGRLCIGFRYPDVPLKEGENRKSMLNSTWIYQQPIMWCDETGWLWATESVAPPMCGKHDGITDGEHGYILAATIAVYKYPLEL